jgi:ubiquinone/menaquinone biosynthesis C-methylase UbiE
VSDPSRPEAQTFLPAASYRLLTPCYDLGSALFGAGRGFKRRVVEAAGIVDGDRVLDVACGTGMLLVIVKERYPGCRVTGMDIDPGILALARKRIGGSGVTAELVCASAAQTGLAASSFDLVASTLAFHHLPLRTKESAVHEVVRVLRPGGTFFLVDLVPRWRGRNKATVEEAGSLRKAFVTNTAETLRGLMSAAGMAVSEERPPRAWALAPWLYAVRGRKPR